MKYGKLSFNGAADVLCGTFCLKAIRWNNWCRIHTVDLERFRLPHNPGLGKAIVKLRAIRQGWKAFAGTDLVVVQEKGLKFED